MVVLEKRLNKGWKEKSASNSTSGSKMYVCMYASKRYCLDAGDWRCNGCNGEGKGLKEKRRFLSCSKAEVKPGIFVFVFIQSNHRDVNLVNSA